MLDTVALRHREDVGEGVCELECEEVDVKHRVGVRLGDPEELSEEV